MLVVDVLIVVILVVALIAGLRRGLLASLGTILGLVAGGLAAFWLLPLISAWLPLPIWRGAAVVAAGIGLLVLGAAIGSAIGRRAAQRRRPHPAQGLRAVPRRHGERRRRRARDRRSSRRRSPSPGAPASRRPISSSRVLQGIDALIPAPVDATLARAARRPSWTTASRGSTSCSRPGGAPAGAARRARRSRTAAGRGIRRPHLGDRLRVRHRCDRDRASSSREDRLVTNAHVVAGVDTPDRRAARPRGAGGARSSTSIRSTTSPSSRWTASTPRRSPLAPALGAGHGRGGAGLPARRTVHQRRRRRCCRSARCRCPTSTTRRAAPREIYALQADVRPGNSGGPLLTDDGDGRRRRLRPRASTPTRAGTR